MESGRHSATWIGTVLCLLMGCADALAGHPDASPATGSSAFAGADRATGDDAAASPGPNDMDSEDTPADAGTAANAAAPYDPFRCGTTEPCTVVVAVPGDCASRMPVPCLEREETSLANRLQRGCGYEPSYNPLELVFELGCATTFRFSRGSKTDHPEVIECLARELGATRFECVDGARLLLYRDTLALP